MRLTRIEPADGPSGRQTLHFDDGRTLTGQLDTLTDFYIYPGKVFQEEEFSALETALAAGAAKKTALRIVNARPLSRRDLVDRLVQKGYLPEAAETAADWLEEIGALDDQAYAAMVVEHYVNQGYGAMRIKHELIRRKVDREFSEEALEAVPDMGEALDRLIRQKLRGEVPDRNALQKTTGALNRRGFTWDEINAGVRRYLDAIEEEA